MLITPKNLKFIVTLSLASRLLVIILQFVSNYLIEDHQADAYRNRYHVALSSDGDIRNNSIVDLIEPQYLTSYKLIEGLTRWDSQYFLEITMDGYTSEAHIAFFPMYPIIIASVRKLLFNDESVSFKRIVTLNRSDLTSKVISVADLENYIKTAIIGVILNNLILFPIACISLFALTKVVKSGDDKYCREVIWWFCFNPASIFFSNCYTESLFAALSFTAISVIEHKSIKYKRKIDLDGPVFPLDQLYRLANIVVLPSAIIFAISSATRSNGLISIGFIWYQFLLKYAELYNCDRSIWSTFVYVIQVIEIMQDALVIIISSTIAASGYIAYQIWCYMSFCKKVGPKNKKGELDSTPLWCNDRIPNPYGYVQAKYWGVGLLSYYQVKKLPNFLLAIPISWLILTEALKESKNFPRSNYNKKLPAYYLHSVVITLFCALFINVEVTTRIIASSCPVLYWICADYGRQRSGACQFLLKFYFILYFTLGAVLHSNFYPWV